MATMQITVRTKAPCEQFLRIIHEGVEYDLKEFAAKFHTSAYALDMQLEKCSIKYRGSTFTLDEYAKRRYDFYESLPFCERYNKEIYPKEHALLAANAAYYKAGKFIKRAQNCLQTARYYLGSAFDLLPNSEEFSWESGYGPIFSVRAMNCSTATVWYNSCFDYILLIIFFAFSIYKEMPDYIDGMKHEDLLKLCLYTPISEVYSKHKANQSFKALWKIVSRCYAAMSEVNRRNNFIKHKGGVDYIGFAAPDPFDVVVRSPDGGVIAQNDDFEAVLVDLDDSVLALAKAHGALYVCLNEIIDFLNYSGFVVNAVDNKRLFASKGEYMPDIWNLPVSVTEAVPKNPD